MRLLAELLGEGGLPSDTTFNYAGNRELGLKDLLAEADRLDRPVRIDHDFYVTRSGSLYFCMQRLDPKARDSEQRVKAWDKFVKAEFGEHDDYLALCEEDELPEGRNLPFFDVYGDSPDAGVLSFGAFLQRFATTAETWVAFVTTQDPIEAKRIDFKRIEMYFAVLTDPDAPMVTHMGISRSFAYLNQAVQDEEVVVHRNLAMRLHGYAAAVMRCHAPDKVYQITGPLDSMRAIMKKEPGLRGHLFSGTTRDWAEVGWAMENPNKELKDASATELDSLEACLSVDPTMTPIRLRGTVKYDKSGSNDQLSGSVTILDKAREKEIYFMDLDQKLARCNGKTFSGDQIGRFAWFHCIELDDPVVLNLAALDRSWY